MVLNNSPKRLLRFFFSLRLTNSYTQHPVSYNERRLTKAIPKKLDTFAASLKKQEIMGFIISCAVYIGVCEGICKMLELEEFNKKAWVYAIVGCVGGFIIKAITS